MYEQKYIDIIGEDNFKKLLDNQTYNFNINDISSKNIATYYAFQHFLIKSYINNYNKPKCVEYLKKIYLDFNKNPYLFCDSPLIKNEVLNKIIDNEEVRNKIINYRNNYFDLKSVSFLYEKKKNQELTNEEKNRYYSYLILKLNNSNTKTEELLNNEIMEILNTDYSKLNDMQLKFYCQYVSNYSKGKGYNTTVMIGKEPSGNEGMMRGSQMNDFIFINKDAFNEIGMLTKTVCHETRHSIQYHDSKEKNTKAGFELAQKELFRKYLNTNNYNSYTSNYRYSSIEIDAEISGHHKASVFLSMFNKRDLAEQIREDRRITTDKRNYYNFMINQNGKPTSKEGFIVNNMDEIIKKNPNELRNYPVLNNIYNIDGNKKKFTTLMTSRMKEDISNRGILDDYIIEGIKTGELNKIPLDKTNKDLMNNYIKTLSSIYRDITIELKDYFEDDRNMYDKKQIETITKYKLALSDILLNYINDNYNTIINSFDNFDSKNPIFDFIYDFRDLDINGIKNETIKNNPELIDKINSQKSLVSNISNKFNKSYLDDKLNKLPQEVLNSNIDVPNIGIINFKDYFNSILPNVDTHKEVKINNQKYYLGDLIVYYSKEVSKNILNDINNKTK